MCLDGGRGTRLTEGKDILCHRVCLASPIPTECGSCSSRHLGRFGVNFGGTKLGFRAGCEVVGCHSCIHIHRAAPQPCETHPSSNWGCSTAIPRTSSGPASSYNRCLKKVTSGAAGQVKKPFDSARGWGCLRSPNKSRAHTVLLPCQSSASLLPAVKGKNTNSN